jgi:hypothetical protein
MGTWLIMTMGVALAMVVYRMRRKDEDKLEQPSNFVMFFHPSKGEGDIFLGGLIVLYLFSRFALDMFQTIRGIF